MRFLHQRRAEEPAVLELDEVPSWASTTGISGDRPKFPSACCHDGGRCWTSTEASVRLQVWKKGSECRQPSTEPRCRRSGFRVFSPPAVIMQLVSCARFLKRYGPGTTRGMRAGSKMEAHDQGPAARQYSHLILCHALSPSSPGQVSASVSRSVANLGGTDRSDGGNHFALSPRTGKPIRKAVLKQDCFGRFIY